LFKAIAFSLSLVAACAPGWAQITLANPGGTPSPVVVTDQVRAELVALAPQGVKPGTTVWAGLQITHQPGWHTYWKNPGDSGLPTRLKWTLPPDVAAGDIAWPAPKKIPIGTLANFGYEGVVLLPVPLAVAPSFQQAASGTLTLQLEASWLVCKQECIPQEGRFALELPTRTSTALHSAAFAAAWAAAPKPLQGRTSVRVEGNALVLSAQGLPAAWVGTSLNVVPETPEIIESAQAPTAQQPSVRFAGTKLPAPASAPSIPNVSTLPNLPNAPDTSSTGDTGTADLPALGTQAWSGGAAPVWTVRIPLSNLRTESPSAMAFVLARDGQSLRTEAEVSGTWPAIQRSAAGETAADLEFTAAPPTARGGWLLALLSALLGGLILNLMPCVFPVLAIKVLAFSGSNERSRASHRAQGLAYTAGVVVSFMALGGLMLALRAGGEQLGWGFQLQSPGVVAALALLFTLLGLNLFGLLHVGHLLPSTWASLQLRHPVGDAFLSGVLAVAIASPCTAPFMGASLGYAIGLPGAQAMGIFAALGLGLALPYLLASWVPAVGRWLPRPGAWMETLRRFLAFPMWATVVWLLWVLGHLSGMDGAASLLALLLAVALLAWSASLQGAGRKVLLAVSVLVCAFLVVTLGPNVTKVEPAAAPLDATAPANAALGSGSAGQPSPQSGQTGAVWQAWAPGRVEAEIAAGRPVFVDFTAAWCITCQLNKKTTLSDAEVLADFAAANVTLLRADWTRRDPAITAALARLGRSGVPVYVLYEAGRAPVVMSEILGKGELRAALAALRAKT
jgi:thiol:disulfide interchange protein DsbD